MNERKTELIKSGIRLFADKGYHETSIQDIATAAGISKGAFYLYFESKAAFIGTTFEYFHTQIMERMEKVYEKELSPLENLANQISVIIDYIDDYKVFIVMQLRENSLFGKSVNELMERIREDNYHWMYNSIIAIYGSEIQRYEMDIIIHLEGLIHGYFKWIVMDQLEIDKTKAGKYLVRRLDNMVQGILQDNDEPLATTPVWEASIEQQVSKQLFIIKRKINELSMKHEEKQALHEVVATILKKVSKEKCEPIIIQGLLAHLQQEEAFRERCERIAHLLDIKLLK